MKRGEGDKLVHNGNPFRADETIFTVESGVCAGAEACAGTESCSEEEACKGNDSCLTVRVYDSEDQFIGLYQYEEEKQRYRPQKIFLGGK